MVIESEDDMVQKIIDDKATDKVLKPETPHPHTSLELAFAKGATFDSKSA